MRELSRLFIIDDLTMNLILEIAYFKIMMVIQNAEI